MRKCFPANRFNYNVLLKRHTFTTQTKNPNVSSSDPTKLKAYQPPPSYKEQVKMGVPLGKRKHYGRAGQTYTQVSFGLSIFIAFIMTPFLGKKIATDEEFRKYIPNWYFESYRSKIPERKDKLTLHEQLIVMQKDLHERAIRGEFTKENRDKMIFSEGKYKDDPYGWSKIHPGVDDEEDDDDENDDKE